MWIEQRIEQRVAMEAYGSEYKSDGKPREILQSRSIPQCKTASASHAGLCASGWGRMPSHHTRPTAYTRTYLNHLSYFFTTKRYCSKDKSATDVDQQNSLEEEKRIYTMGETTLPQSHRQKIRRRVSDLITQKSPEQEAKEKRRYERDTPPVELERHEYWKTTPDRSVNKALIRTDLFEEIKDKNKDSFITTLEMFAERDIHLRGHVEFIYAALSQMKKFGVHRDLEAYKKIIDVFPKGIMIATNMFQVEFMHYPKQQQCAIDILEQMEDFGVIPDTEVQDMLANCFGSQSFPMRKAGRMLYWLPKFKYLSPWALPEPLPTDSLELAKLAIQRITSVDLSTKISVFEAEKLEGAADLTWVVSGQSPDQQQLIETHPANQPIYVEGAFRVWLQRVCINYFILRAEPRKRDKTTDTPSDPDDVSKLDYIFEENYTQNALETVPTVHEQDDGIILAVCATGTSSKDSVATWIRLLEQTNPRLGTDIPVLFTLKSPIGPTDDLEIPTFEEAEKMKLLSGSVDNVYSGGSGGKLGVDPRLPNLKQMGIWSESETTFPNWPHHHHPEDSPSFKNLEENLRRVDQLEEEIETRRRLQPQSQPSLGTDNDNNTSPVDKLKEIKS